MLEIKAREAAGVTVLDMNGSLLAGRGPVILSECIRELVAAQRLNILLNAKGVSVIDSSGVGDLVASYSHVKKSGGRLKIASPTKAVRDVLQITRISSIIEIHDSEEAALKSFAP